MTQPSPPPSRLFHIERRLLIGFFIVALLALAFLNIASEVREGDTLLLDRRLLLMLRVPGNPAQPIGPAWLQAAMLDFTAIGGTWVLALLTLLVTGFLLVARRWKTAGFVVASVAGGALLSVALKQVFLRARPEVALHLVVVDTPSFPSGHATNSAIVYLTLGVLLARTQAGGAVRAYVMGTAIVLTLLVGVSRVYAGVHWPSDVLAGWCVGAGWAGLCSLLARAVSANRKGQGQPAN